MTGNVVDLARAIELRAPAGTADEPYLQLDWIFEQRSKRVRSASGRKNYQIALTHYKSFLTATGAAKPFSISQHWDALALVRFKSWLMTSGVADLSSHSKVGIMSAVRQAMVEATLLELTSEELVNASVGAGYRETDAHAPYDNQELAVILDAVREESQYVLAVLRGYVPSGAGRDPQVMPPGFNYRTNQANGLGWSVFENLQWYFENRLNCKPVIESQSENAVHQQFFYAARRYFGNTRAVYRRLGVSQYLDEDLLGPLLIQLLYQTGLNPTSAVELELDCLSVHPLAGVPVLKYFKKRSGGEKELFIDLLNHDTEAVGGLTELTLKREQAILVERVIARIADLTAPLRTRPGVPSELQNKLFIYESSSFHVAGKVLHFSVEKVRKWCQEVRDRHDLRATNGEPLTFNLVRFRPTKLTEMAANGKDFFEIQHVAGHKSIKQTLAYIEQRTLDAVADREVTKAMETIWANHEEFAPVAQATPTKVIPIAPYKGLISDCKNVYDPPKQVTLAADYVPGQACTRFNMCLLCKNVVVMKEHLPTLAHYRAQLRTVLSNSSTDLPQVALYERSLSVLDQIFDGDVTEFSDDDLAAAEAAAISMDILVDPLTYTGVEA